MFTALRRFFSADGFMPHGHCYLWEPDILWTHVVSDLLIGLAYVTIPLALWYLLRRRKDIPFNRIMALFAVFIVSCGMTHFIEVWTTWHPAYRLAGAVKAVTAAASVLTATQLVRFLPAAIALPNITQYQNMYELARDSQEAYRGILEASLNAFFILELPPLADGGPPDVKIVDVNATASAQLGLPREAVAGRLLRDLGDREVIRPLVPAILAVGRTRRPTSTEHHVAEGDRSYIAQIAPLGERVGLTLYDITEQKRAMEAARESERRYRFVVSRAPVTVFALDRQGRYVLADGQAYRRLGVDPATLPGKRSEDVFAHSPGALDLVRRGLAGQEAEERVEVGSLTLKSHVSPLRGPDGAVVGLTGLSVDITDQVEAERELAAAARDLERRVEERTRELEVTNAELQSFAYSVAHDLRSPLRTMDGFADAIERDDATALSPASRSYLSRIRAGARRLSTLIDDLLKLSRVTRAELIRQPVDLSGLARGIVAELRSHDPAREVDVDIEPAMFVVGDPFLLRIALDNLLGNAWKFTSKRERARIHVGVTTTREGERAYVVRDNGVGFDMQFVGQLFAPFQRLHKRTEFEGTGIGLATVKRVVTRHGGSVWAEAKEGEGAAFYFTLP